MIVGAAEVSAAHLVAAAGGEPEQNTRVVHRPMSVLTDGAGAPVPAGASGAEGPPVDGLLARVGDPVPVRVGTSHWPAEQLVARVVAGAAAAVAPGSTGHLVLAVPDEWRDHRRAALGDAVTVLTGLPVSTVGAATALLEGDDQAEAAGPALVITAGTESFGARLCSPHDGAWQVQRTSHSEWGGNDVDDALLDFVRERSQSVGAKGAQDAFAARAACAAAREDLARRTATEVDLPGAEPVRLVRADLELVVGPTVCTVIDQLVADVAGSQEEDSLPSRVLVTGPLASLPMVVEALSRATGRSVEHVTAEHAIELHARVAAAALESAAEAATPDETASPDEQDTEVIPLAPVPPVRRRGRGRRQAVMVAASLAAAASVAAVTLTAAGEDALVALIDGTVPQATASGKSVKDLADAAELPRLPWGDASDDEGQAAGGAAAVDGGDAGDEGGDARTEDGGAGTEDGPGDPEPTSTKGGDGGGDSDKGKVSEKDKGSEKDGKESSSTESSSSADDSTDKETTRSADDTSTTPTRDATSSADGSSTTPQQEATSGSGTTTPGTPGTTSPGTTSPDPVPDPTTPPTSAPEPSPTPTPVPEPEPEPTSTSPTSDPAPSPEPSASTTTAPVETTTSPATSSAPPEPGTA